MNTSFDYAQLDTILENHGYSSTNIIAILQDTQEVYRYLPEEIFSYFAKKLG